MQPRWKRARGTAVAPPAALPTNGITAAFLVSTGKHHTAHFMDMKGGASSVLERAQAAQANQTMELARFKTNNGTTAAFFASPTRPTGSNAKSSGHSAAASAANSRLA